MIKSNILIADDDKNIRELLKEILEKNYNIFEAVNGKDAIEQLMDGNNFALVLLDLMMPKFDGYEVAKQIIDNNIDIPFIFLTAKGESKFMVKGLELGADDYVIKPFTSKELELRIKRKLDMHNKIKFRNKIFQLINHNIKTPINGILGAIQLQDIYLNEIETDSYFIKVGNDSLLIQKEDFDMLMHKLRESNKIMNESLEYLIKISNDFTTMFNISKIPINKSSILLSELIYRSVSSAKPKKLICNISDPIPMVKVFVDIEKIQKVFYELFDNAVLHNSSSNPEINIMVDTKDDTVIISIKDNAKGIGRENFDDVFMEFWTGNEIINHTRGQGIGLWICKKYLNAHNGEIWIEQSEIAKGSEIRFTLPIHKDN